MVFPSASHIDKVIRLDEIDLVEGTLIFNNNEQILWFYRRDG